MKTTWWDNNASNIFSVYMIVVYMYTQIYFLLILYINVPLVK